MIDDDDDLDGLLFDEIDEESAAAERTNVLVVGARPASPETVNDLEGLYRRQGLPPVIFEEDDEAGQSYLGNVSQFARLMKLPPDILPTEGQVLAWIAARRWPSFEW
jgi:hypothetical protein